MEELVEYKEIFMRRPSENYNKYRCLIIECENYKRGFNLEGSIDEDLYNLNNIVRDIVKKDKYYNNFKIIDYRNGYDIVLIYRENLLEINDVKEEDYINSLKRNIERKINTNVYIYKGKEIDDSRDIITAYNSAVIQRVLDEVSKIKNINEMNDKLTDSYSLGKAYIREIINGIQEYNQNKIIENIDLLYYSFKINLTDLEVIKMEFNYLIYKTIILLKDLNLEHSNNIIKFITYDLNEILIRRGSYKYLKGFLLELSKYIKEAKESLSLDVLTCVVNEINDNYMNKISLKTLGKKYFINSAYLGQLFMKKYNKNFKDYLNEVRIEKAVELLCNSDNKVYEISELVGYSNTDYFIKKFMEIKGTTPLRYKVDIAKL